MVQIFRIWSLEVSKVGQEPNKPQGRQPIQAVRGNHPPTSCGFKTANPRERRHASLKTSAEPSKSKSCLLRLTWHLMEMSKVARLQLKVDLRVIKNQYMIEIKYIINFL